MESELVRFVFKMLYMLVLGFPQFIMLCYVYVSSEFSMQLKCSSRGFEVIRG